MPEERVTITATITLSPQHIEALRFISGTGAHDEMLTYIRRTGEHAMFDKAAAALSTYNDYLHSQLREIK